MSVNGVLKKVSQHTSQGGSSLALEKLQAIRQYLNATFYESETTIDLLLTAWISRNHICLIGEPGVAKSALAETAIKCVTDADKFSVQLAKDTPASKVFGALILSGLMQGIEAHNLTGALADVDFGIVHEIFKANSILLDNFLSILESDRIFYNNKLPVQCPLISLVGTSNELPEKEDSQEALLDRFVIKCEVKDIQRGKNAFALARSKRTVVALPQISIAELQAAQTEAMNVVIPDDILHTLTWDQTGNGNSIREKLSEKGFRISPRRQVQLWGEEGIAILKAYAYLKGDSEVTEDHFDILPNCLWRTPDQCKEITKIIKSIGNPVDQAACAIFQHAEKIVKGLGDYKGKDDLLQHSVWVAEAATVKIEVEKLIKEIGTFPQTKKTAGYLKDIKKLYKPVAEQLYQIYTPDLD